MTESDLQAMSDALAEALTREKPDSSEARQASYLIKELLKGDTEQGTLTALKRLREIVLSTLCPEGYDLPAVRRRLEESALTPVLAEYLLVALARFEPIQDDAAKTRKNFSNAFGLTFTQGAAPLTKGDRATLSEHFHNALYVLHERRRSPSTSPNDPEPLNDEDIDAAFRQTFRTWKAREY